MNKYAVHHTPDGNYAYAVARDTIVVTLRTAQNDVFDGIEILYQNKYIFTERRLSKEMRKCASDGVFSYYRAEITLPDARFAYIFKLIQKEKIYYFSEDGISDKYSFGLSYYTFFQFPFINAVDVPQVAGWTKNAVFYQIFVDRFARGDFQKDDSYINTDWNGKIDRYSFCGGDLQGIENKLPYLKESGFNALYLTPVFLSDSNHKYGIRDYLQVDPQFGGNGKLKSLLSAAHAQDIKIIVDCVFNHCDADHPYFLDVREKGRKSEYFDWFIIDGDFPSVEKRNYACFAYCGTMPKWNTSNPDVRRYLTDIALQYLKTGFDGLRLDVADEISHEMWRLLRREVKTAYPEAVIIGEIWHDSGQWLKGDQLDGVMNYKLQKILVDYFGQKPIKAASAANAMNALLIANTEQANSNYLNFLDSHDTPRFFRTAGGNEKRLLCALCAVVMFPGMPCVFYGTEIPLDGGGDPDCRRPFDWTFKNRSPFYKEKFNRVIGLKKQCAFSDASAEISEEDGLLKIIRKTDGGTVCAYFNTSGSDKKIRPDGKTLFSINYSDGIISNDGSVVVENIKN